MSYGREWADLRNAAGFAAECARLALPFYKGDHRQDLVTAIELAERYASGEEIAAYAAAYAAYAASDAAADAADAAVDAAAHAAAADAAYAAYAAAYAAYGASDASSASARAGADTHEIRAAFARWVVRDLRGGRDLSAELRQAAGAAVVAGDEAFAKELLNTSQRGAV